MKVLLINLEFDCAGVSWHLRNALNATPGWSACSVVRRFTPAANKADFRYCEIEDVVYAAAGYDVLHFNNWIWTHKPSDDAFGFHPYNEWGEGHPFEKYVGKKKFVFHFHGGFHQLNPANWVMECKMADARMLKCDPIAPLPYATWLPNVLDIDGIEGRTTQECDGVRMALHGDVTDGRRNNKAIIASMGYLQRLHNVVCTPFNGIPRQEALALRRGYNVSVDNLTQGFVGMWGWESLAIGQVLMSRLDDRAGTAYCNMFDGEVPILNTSNVDYIGDRVMFYLKHPSALERDCRAASAWAHTHYRPEVIARKYVDFYESW